MATIPASSGKKIMRISHWLGLNESPDGDTGLRPGEGAVMRNFRVTQEGHLQIRPGTKTILTLPGGGAVRGLWHGYVDNTAHLLAASGGHVWDIDTSNRSFSSVGEIDDAAVTFFGFAKKVYILTGSGYYVWDGENSVSEVEGYVPIVSTAAPPAGGGTLLEPANKLTGKKRQRFSPDGASAVFHLAETKIDSVDSVTVDGTVKIVSTHYTVNLTAGTVTFASVPAQGVNSVEIAWTRGTGDRAAVEGMKYCELYSGATDARVFLYGDGSNQALYSGLEHDGSPSAEYFPDLNVLNVGEANTPVTGLVRHFSSMIAFKPNATYSVRYTTLTLDTGAVTAGFCTTPVNRELGNSAPGQVRVLENNPWTLCENAVYEWKTSCTALPFDERQAKRRSDPVSSTLSGFKLSACVTFDDEWNHEYYIVSGPTALVYNYGNDTWYVYTGFPALCMARVQDAVYFGTADGKITHVSRDWRNDDGAKIDAWWESGSMAFSQDWRRKYSSELWVSMMPESQARAVITARSNRKADYPEKVLSSGLSTFLHTNFFHFSFKTNRRPQLIREKLKVKKATYYKLIFYSRSASATATILGVDLQVRDTGIVK